MGIIVTVVESTSVEVCVRVCMIVDMLTTVSTSVVGWAIVAVVETVCVRVMYTVAVPFEPAADEVVLEFEVTDVGDVVVGSIDVVFENVRDVEVAVG